MTENIIYREAANNVQKMSKGLSSKPKSKKKNGKKKGGKKKKRTPAINSRAQTKADKAEPLNKGPYGFEHPEVIDVSTNALMRLIINLCFSGLSPNICVLTAKTR